MVWERTHPAIQEMVDDEPKANQYYSDAFDAYDRLLYHLGSNDISVRNGILPTQLILRISLIHDF